MISNGEFIDKLCELMGGDNFFMCDQYDQDTLFEMQDSIAKHITESANEGSSLASKIIENFPRTFTTEEV